MCLFSLSCLEFLNSLSVWLLTVCLMQTCITDYWLWCNAATQSASITHERIMAKSISTPSVVWAQRHEERIHWIKTLFWISFSESFSYLINWQLKPKKINEFILDRYYLSLSRLLMFVIHLLLRYDWGYFIYES